MMDKTIDLVKTNNTADVVNELKIRRRGRYKKDDPRSGTADKWEPIEWKENYDLVVMLSLQGLTYKTIGDRLNYTEVHVGNIIRSKQGVILRGLFQERLKQKILEEIPDRLAALGDAAIKNMSEILVDPVVREKNPIAIYDRSAEMLEHLGKMKSSKPIGVVINNNNLSIPAEHATIFMEGLRKRQEFESLDRSEGVRMLPAPANAIEVPAIEVEKIKK